jgi:hypothetical protein
MKVLLVLALLAVACVAVKPKWHELRERNYDFEQYKRDFSRNYAGKEHAKRKAIFDANLKEILVSCLRFPFFPPLFFSFFFFSFSFLSRTTTTAEPRATRKE